MSEITFDLQLNCRYLLTGAHPKPLNTLQFYRERQYYDVISGNLFDGDKSYSMVGFTGKVTVKLEKNQKQLI